MKRLALCLLLVLPLSGCAKFDRATFNTLAVTNSVLETAQQDYESGKLPHNVCIYNLINRGKAAQGVAQAAFMDEWTTEQAKGDVTALQAQIAIDLADIAPLVTQIKNLYKNPTCTALSGGIPDSRDSLHGTLPTSYIAGPQRIACPTGITAAACYAN